MKQCTRCKIQKEDSNFRKQIRGKLGLRSICKTCAVEYSKNYRISHPDTVKPYMKKYLKEYCKLEKYKESQREAYQKNKEKIKERQHLNRPHTREYERNKVHNNIQFRLSKRLRIRLWDAIREDYKSGSAVRDLGCTIAELKKYLESKFKEGMTWESWGNYGWHIDHIKPLISFDLTDRSQLLKAVHFTNLQPLWAIENLTKQKKAF